MGFSTSLLVHLDLLKSLDRAELHALSAHLASMIYASIKIRRPGTQEILGFEKS